jgi:integrase
MSRPTKHLRFEAWPLADRSLWLRTFAQDPFDDEHPTAHLAAATVVGLRTSYARYLGFLDRHDPARLRLAPETRIDPVSIKAFVAHLRQSCRDTSVASLLHTLRLALRFLFPNRDWSWLKTVTRRIQATAIPFGDRARGITSAELYAIGIALIATAEEESVSSGPIAIETALQYRDGLIIALLAVVPLRRRTLAALTIDKHLVKVGEHWLLDIPAADTKTRRELEFPLPDELSRLISRYLTRFRPMIPGANNHDGLWPSMRGRTMGHGSIYDMVRRRTTEALGFPVNLHRFRIAAGNLWSIADPANVRGVKDLLGQTKFGTTEKHYIGGQSRLAGRALAKVLSGGKSIKLINDTGDVIGAAKSRRESLYSEA